MSENGAKPFKEYRIFKFFSEQSVFVNLATLFTLAVGGFIALTIVKEAFPAINFDIVIVSTAYPGGTPEDVERLVSVPLERSLKAIDGIEDFESYSVENQSTLVITLDPDAPNKDKVVRDIEREVDRVRVTELPEDGDEPQVLELKADNPVINVGVSGEVDEMRLRQIARKLEDEFLEIEGVSDIVRSNYRKQEIWVEADARKLKDEHLSLNDLVGAIRAANHNSQGGKLEIHGKETLIRAEGNLVTAEDVGRVIARANAEGRQVRVADVAVVRDTLERRAFDTRVDGKPTINLTVKKKVKGDALKIKDEVLKVVERWRGAVRDEGVTFSYSNDITFYIKRRLDVLLRNGTTGMVLVLMALFFFLSPRSALWTALAIPIAYLGGLIIMDHFGYTINLLSLFSFILVSGMLVDDGIVVSEHYERLREEGLSARRAASVAASEMAFPITAAVLTTIIAFMPLAYVSGIMGKFLRQFPVVVVAVLIVDLVECLFVLPNHLAEFGYNFRLPGPLERVRACGPRLMAWLEDRYARPLEWFVTRPYKGIAVFTAVFVLSLGLSVKFLKFEMFPVDADQLFLAFELPLGATLEETSEKAKLLEAVAKKLPKEEVTNVITEVGLSGDERRQKRGNNIGQLKIMLDVTGKRTRSGEAVLAGIEKELEDVAKRAGFVEFEVKKAQRGPPSGAAIDFRLIGDDLDVLSGLAHEAQEFLRAQTGVFGVRDDLDEGKPEILLAVDREQAARAGVSPAVISQAVRAAFNGETATEIKRSDVEEDIEVRVKFPEEARRREDTLGRVDVAAPGGRLVPLDTLVHVRKDVGLLSIVRRDGKRTIRVTGDVKREAASAPEVARKVAGFLDQKLQAHPEVTYEFGGEEKERVESLDSLKKAMVVAILVIYILLASLFQSFVQPFIILSILPFAFVGVFLTLLLHGLPLSMLVLIGLTGLMGVVVNNSILIVEAIRREHHYIQSAPSIAIVVKACRTRLRPILLTSFTTFFGVLPLGYGIGGNEPFLAHTALTFGWGLVFCSVITLFLVPVVYAFSLRAKTWPRRIAVKVGLSREKVKEKATLST